MEQGIIYKTTGSWYTIKHNNDFLNARLKGIHKKDKEISSTNPIAVGDHVLFTTNPDSGDESDYMITEILPRRNYIVRSSPHNARQKHIIASNLDGAVLIATLREPRTSLGFIDRFLVICEMFHIPATIIFNKKDIYGEEELIKYQELKEIYEDVGYSVYLVSSLDKNFGEEVKGIFDDKFTLLSGHSGVGKSTFLNALIPGLDIRTREVSQSSGKGLHTTTFAEAYDIDEHSTIIDTPGIRELGITELERSELAGYYPEMRKHIGDCAFNDCLHVKEPKCAIKDHLEKEISTIRYQNYRAILDSIEDNVF